MDQDPDNWGVILFGSGSKLFDIVNCYVLNYYFVTIYIHALQTAVFRIRIFRIRMFLGLDSVPDPEHFGVDPDPRIHASD